MTKGKRNLIIISYAVYKSVGFTILNLLSLTDMFYKISNIN